MKQIFKRSISSFRDRDGFVFFDEDGLVFRAVAQSYEETFDAVTSSELYAKLHKQKLLVNHTDQTTSYELEGHYKILGVQKIPFISYPYEWSFTQLKEAALLTLKVQKESLNKGFSLKDANAYNVQFLNQRAIFIDTLSFEKLNPNEPWIAYHQFCTFFLGPLLLMKYCRIDANELLKIYLEGIPLDLVSQMLPRRTKVIPSIYMHIHLHARFSQSHERNANATKKLTFSKEKHLRLIENLTETVKKIELNQKESTWNTYYENGLLSDEYFNHKVEAIKLLINEIEYSSAWDIGCNNGFFSKLLHQSAQVISTDLDHLTIDRLSRELKKQSKYANILPLVVNLSNPNSGTGWLNKERASFLDRINVDLILALALLHHLVVSNNLSFGMIAELFASKTRNLIIEYVPKDDPNVSRIMGLKKDVFDDYSHVEFINAFQKHFDIKKEIALEGTKRILYLMSKK